jgi:hypothetical protein
MTTDSNEQGAAKSEVASGAKVGTISDKKSPRRFPVPLITKKRLAVCLVIVLASIGLWLLAHNVFHVGQKVYAQAAGHKIYKADIEGLVGNTKGVSDHQAAVVLANQYLTEAMAKKADVTVTNKDLIAHYGTSLAAEKGNNRYAYQAQVNNVYFDKLIAYNAGLYQGKLLVANFSRHIAFQSPFLDIQKATDPLMGNPAAVAADKKYAQDFITKLYNQVKSGQITFDQAIQQEHNDSVVGKQAYQTLPHSGSFNTSDVSLGGTALVLPQSIQPQISAMKAGELSKPFVVSVNNSLTQKGVTTDSYYLVVRMDATTGGKSGLSYDQYLAQSKKELGYKVNV